MKKDWKMTALKWAAAAVGAGALVVTAYLYDWIAVGLVFAGEIMFTIYGMLSVMEEAQENGGKANAESADVSVQ